MTLLVLPAAASVYLLNEWVLKSSGVGFFGNHLNDVIAGAMLLAIANVITPPDNLVSRFVASALGSAIILVVASFVWEVAAPHILSNSTGDPLDVIAYFGGGAAYLTLAGQVQRSRI